MRLKFLLPYIFLLTVFVAFGQNKPLSKNQQTRVEKYKNLLEKYKKENNVNKVGNQINKIAFIYWDTENYDWAIEYFKESLELNKKLGNINAVKLIYSNLGTMYSDLSQLEKSIFYFEESLKIRREIGVRSELAKGLIDLATVFTSLEKANTSNILTLEALKISKELDEHKYLRSAYGLLSQNYELLGNKKKSYEFFDKYVTYEKSLQQEDFKVRENNFQKKLKKVEYIIKNVEADNLHKKDEISKQIEQLKEAKDSLIQQEIDNATKQQEIDILFKDKKLQDLEIKRKEVISKNNRLIRNFIIIALIFVVVMAFLFFMRMRERKKDNMALSKKNDEIQQQYKEIQQQSQKIAVQKNSIESKNKDITDSINYAKQIQQAILPSSKSLQDYLKDSFIFFKPRDIVSGDFYWFARVTNGIKDKFIITAVDCTGHGVPGAFMSMIGVNLLNQIIARKITKSSLILTSLHQGVRKALKQKETENRDGMDMALCVIDKENKTLTFSGAKSPMIYIQDGEIKQIKGDKVAIGGRQHEDKRIFGEHTISIEKETTVYIFSDGFPDQFGGEKGRKFMIKRFRDLLVKIHQKTMEEQKAILDKTLNNWIDNRYKQIDDILVIGFKI